MCEVFGWSRSPFSDCLPCIVESLMTSHRCHSIRACQMSRFICFEETWENILLLVKTRVFFFSFYFKWDNSRITSLFVVTL